MINYKNMKNVKLLLIGFLGALIFSACNDRTENMPDLSKKESTDMWDKTYAVDFSFSGDIVSDNINPQKSRGISVIAPGNETSPNGGLNKPKGNPKVKFDKLLGKHKINLCIEVCDINGNTVLGKNMQETDMEIKKEGDRFYYVINEFKMIIPVSYNPSQHKVYLSGIFLGDFATKDPNNKFKFNINYKKDKIDIEESGLDETKLNSKGYNVSKGVYIGGNENIDRFEMFKLNPTNINQEIEMPTPPMVLGRKELKIDNAKKRANIEKGVLFPIGSYIAIVPFNGLNQDVKIKGDAVIETNAFSFEGYLDFGNMKEDKVKFVGSNEEWLMPKWNDEFESKRVGSKTLQEMYISNYTHSYNIRFNDIKSKSDGEEIKNESYMDGSKRCYMIWVMPNKLGNILFSKFDCKVKDNETGRFIDAGYSSDYLYTNLCKKPQPIFAKTNGNGAISFANYTLNMRLDTEVAITGMMSCAEWNWWDWKDGFISPMIQLYNKSKRTIDLSEYSLARVRDFNTSVKNTVYHAYPKTGSEGAGASMSLYYAMLLNLNLGSKSWEKYAYNLEGVGIDGKEIYYHKPECTERNNLTEESCYPVRWKQLYTNANYQFDGKSLRPTSTLILTGAGFYGRPTSDVDGLFGNGMGLGDNYLGSVNPDITVIGINDCRKHKDRGCAGDFAGVMNGNPGDGYELFRRVKVAVFNTSWSKTKEFDTYYTVDCIGPTRTNDAGVWQKWHDRFQNKPGGDKYHRVFVMRKKSNLFPTGEWDGSGWFFQDFLPYKPKIFGQNYAID